MTETEEALQKECQRIAAERDNAFAIIEEQRLKIEMLIQTQNAKQILIYNAATNIYAGSRALSEQTSVNKAIDIWNIVEAKLQAVTL